MLYATIPSNNSSVDIAGSTVPYSSSSLFDFALKNPPGLRRTIPAITANFYSAQNDIDLHLMHFILASAHSKFSPIIDIFSGIGSTIRYASSISQISPVETSSYFEESFEADWIDEPLLFTPIATRKVQLRVIKQVQKEPRLAGTSDELIDVSG